jgi:hypothetical protein
MGRRATQAGSRRHPSTCHTREVGWDNQWACGGVSRWPSVAIWLAWDMYMCMYVVGVRRECEPSAIWMAWDIGVRRECELLAVYHPATCHTREVGWGGVYHPAMAKRVTSRRPASAEPARRCSRLSAAMASRSASARCCSECDHGRGVPIVIATKPCDAKNGPQLLPRARVEQRYVSGQLLEPAAKHVMQRFPRDGDTWQRTC